ncbi:MAG TPA: class I SAM-dependent methyltransferase [Phycisphaerales bacterium]|nr:class I SAM-dependent methyltransferase [Phycisphaerales bacterium]
MPSPQSTPAWTSDSLRDPHHAPDKAARVEQMFAAIARSYDLNNRLHSFFRDQAWRHRVVQLAAPTPQDRVLDVACGTGDLTLAFYNHSPRPVSITGLDFTQAMLDVAAIKLRRTLANHLSGGMTVPVVDHAPANHSGGTGILPVHNSDFSHHPSSATEHSLTHPPISFLRGDAMSLPFPHASFDILTIAFGLRNIADPLRALREFRRVLAPKGRLLILEFSSPRNPLIRAFNAVYCNRIMPFTASLIARDRSGAYRYLPRSVKTFMSPAELASHLAPLGFTDITSRPLTFGVCTITSAHLPSH